MSGVGNSYRRYAKSGSEEQCDRGSGSCVKSRELKRQRLRRQTLKRQTRKTGGLELRTRQKEGFRQWIRRNGKWKRQEWETVLREALEAPAPQRKKAFLRGIRRGRVSNRQFILQQAAYIRKWVWMLSFGVFLTALAGGRILDRDVLWLLSAMMPFLAVSSVAEYIRAEVHGMTELEMAARYSRKSVLLARMCVLGIVHLGTLCLVSLCGYREGVTVFRTGIYLLAPYLLTDVAALWLVRRMQGREALYACLGLAVIVGILPVLNKYMSIWLWQEEWFGKWLWASAVLGVAAAYEWKKSMERMEELAWS